MVKPIQNSIMYPKLCIPNVYIVLIWMHELYNYITISQNTIDISHYVSQISIGIAIRISCTPRPWRVSSASLSSLARLRLGVALTIAGWFIREHPKQKWMMKCGTRVLMETPQKCYDSFCSPIATYYDCSFHMLRCSLIRLKVFNCKTI